MPAAQSPQLSPQQQNMMARNSILSTSVERIQQIFSTNIATLNGSNNVINVVPRNVGLIKGFFVDVSFNITTSAASAPLAVTPFGAANCLSQIVFNDLQNNTRIQTSGWHLHAVNSARIGAPFAIPFAVDTSAGIGGAKNKPVSYGDVWNINHADDVVPVSTVAPVVFRYYVPLAYSKTDLRGAVYANVINATMQLQLVLNNSMVVEQAADGTLAVYKGSSAAAVDAPISDVEITVYQHYLDQLPMGTQGPILPWLDLSTIYELKNTSLTGLSTGQDFPIPYSNYRSYLSTFFIYDNAGVLTAGSDLNYVSLQSANYTNLIKVTPDELALLSYVYMKTGWPVGTYYLSHRDDPISTIQYGNMDLIINASSASAASQILVGYEDLAMTNLLNNAGSMPGG